MNIFNVILMLYDVVKFGSLVCLQKKQSMMSRTIASYQQLPRCACNIAAHAQKGGAACMYICGPATREFQWAGPRERQES